MITKTRLAQNSRFKIGWLLLLVTAALMLINHLMLIFVLEEALLFTLAAAFNLYALIVILIPLRRGEKWAWLTTWILPVVFVVTSLNDRNIAIFYLSVAVVCAAGLLVIAQDFFPGGRQNG